jgi:hypothetical protein
MLRREFIQAQIQKLAQVLARIIDLKKEGVPEEARALLENTLKEDFALEPSLLRKMNREEFLVYIRSANYGPEKTDLLAQFLYEDTTPFHKDDSGTKEALLKVLALYDLLESEYHLQSLQNLSRRTQIQNFLLK